MLDNSYRIVKNILNYVLNGNNALLEFTSAEVRGLSNKHRPLDGSNFSRSSSQFRIQKEVWLGRAPKTYVCFEVLSAVLILLVVPYLLMRSSKRAIDSHRLEGFLGRPHEYAKTGCNKDLSVIKGRSLSRKDVGYVMSNTMAYSPFYLLRLFLNISKFSSGIDMGIKSFYTCFEYSSSSSFVKQYVEDRCDGKLINVMHGEKLYLPRDLYASFHEVYIWEGVEEELLKKLNWNYAKCTKYIPVFVSEITNENTAQWDLVYFLGNQNNEKLEIIVEQLKLLDNLRVAIKPHPKYLDSQIKVIGSSIEVVKGDIAHILSKSAAVCGEYSTVLRVALMAGKRVVFDDTTDHELLDKLIDLEYSIVLKMDRLSNMLWNQ